MAIFEVGRNKCDSNILTGTAKKNGDYNFRGFFVAKGSYHNNVLSSYVAILKLGEIHVTVTCLQERQRKWGLQVEEEEEEEVEKKQKKS